MSSTVLKIPLEKEFAEELEDAFIDKKDSAHDFVWLEIKALCKDAKLGKLSKSCVYNSIRNGQPTQDSVKLKEVTLKELPSDPTWIPDNFNKEDVTFFEHKITETTKKYLELYGSFNILRHEQYCQALVDDQEKTITKMEQNGADPNLIADAKEALVELKSKFEENAPVCLEQAIFVAIYPKLLQEVTANIDKEFDKENEQMYPKEETPSK